MPARSLLAAHVIAAPHTEDGGSRMNHARPRRYAKRLHRQVTAAAIVVVVIALTVAGLVNVVGNPTTNDSGTTAPLQAPENLAARSAPPPTPGPSTGGLSRSSGGSAVASDRERSASRSTVRGAVRPLVPAVKRKLWTTAPLKLRYRPQPDSRSRGVVDDGERVGATGTRRNGFALVVVDRRAHWVTARYLSRSKPVKTPPAAAIGAGPCANGVAASGGLAPAAQRVMNAVCARFPEITTYGGRAGRGEHSAGLAIDIMVSGTRGVQVRDYLYSLRNELGLSNVIHARQIWSAARDGEGFRGMEDRGSVTQNHYDHVHVLAL
ncbi:hypothetical protein [Nocardioides marmoraquaticus]